MGRGSRGVRAALAVLLLASCASPGGVDGDLTDDWGRHAEPVVFVPEAGTCHGPAFEYENPATANFTLYAPDDCAEAHYTETVHVGTFPADLAKAPAAHSEPLRAAYADCSARARDFVGDDWRGARLAVWVVTPTAAGWEGGGRWYRCDLGELETIDHDVAAERAGSLRDVLRAPTPLRHRCFNPRDLDAESVSYMVAVDCGRRHRAEFAGIWTAPESSFDAFEKARERNHQGCLKVIAGFARLPKDGDLEYRIGTVRYEPDAGEWALGERGVQCFLWSDDRDLTRSMKGAGPGALPVATA